MTDLPARPAHLPARPYFSSGPCAKPPGWTPANLATELLGRSHRSKIGKARLQYSIDLMRELLKLPETHRIGIVPGSDTGAFEMAMWTMLGAKPVTALAWESFGEGWVTDAVKQLKIDPTVLRADYGQLPDLNAVDWSNDVLFTWNGTTSGVRVPDADWIADDREGLAICDATSAAFAMPLPFDKLDVVTFSFQKALGGEAGIGVMVLSPRAVARLDSYRPERPVPKLLRLTDGKGFDRALADGVAINTFSVLTIEDWIDALEWAQGIGGLSELIRRTDANFAALADWVERTDWIAFLPERPEIRSTTSVCLKFVDPRVTGLDEAGQKGFVKRFKALLEGEGAVFDMEPHRNAPPGLRLWCGCTVETADVVAATPWLEWAFETAVGELS